MNSPRTSRIVKSRSPIVGVVGVALTIATLYFAQEVLIPLALSVLLTFLLTPLANRLQRVGLHRIPAVLAVTALAFGVILGLGGVVGTQLVKLADDLPRYQDNIKGKAKRLRGFGGHFGSTFNKLGKEISGPATEPATTQSGEQQPADTARTLSRRATTAPIDAAREATGQSEPTTAPAERGTAENPFFVVATAAPEWPVKTLFGYLGYVLGPLGTAALVIVFVVFMLLDREDLRDRAIRLVSRGKYTVTTRALDDAGHRISRYVLAQTIVNGSYGVIVGFGLWLIGVTMGRDGDGHYLPFPSFVLWGLLAAVLRFIPYVGPVTAAVFPLALSLAVYPGFGVFVAVGAMLIGIELISNNVMEPWLYGTSTGLSTMAIIVAAVFWTWLWGPIGLFMSTPLTVCIVVVGKHVRQLAFLDVLLGDQPALPPGVRFYQRLLAGDVREAEIVMAEAAKEHGGHEVPDRVLLPALRLARRDQVDQDLSSDEEATLLDTATRILDKRAVDCEVRANFAQNKSDAGEAALPTAAPPKVVGCPAHHRSEELALRALDQLGLPDAYCMSVLSSRLMHSQVEKKVAEIAPAAVFVAVLPPGGGPQARFLCRRLRKAFPDLPIVVGYFGKVRNYDRLLVRFRRAGANYVTTSVTQGKNQIVALLKPAGDN